MKMNKLVTAQDILGEVHDFIVCVWMAATDLEEPLQRAPIQRVATASAAKINEVIDLLAGCVADGAGTITAVSAKPKSRPVRTKRSGK